MANRSDRNSILPRQLKRMLSLDRYTDNEAQRSAIRKLFISAHAHEEHIHKEMLAGRVLYTNQKASEIQGD